VDNGSRDRTAEIARAYRIRVVYEPVHNVARVRSAGAATAHGEVLIFVDADAIVPYEFLDRVKEAMADAMPRRQRRHCSSCEIRSSSAYLGACRWTGFKLGWLKVPRSSAGLLRFAF
jgi:glycosyltransferase involved in cell wall biosynthesis